MKIVNERVLEIWNFFTEHKDDVDQFPFNYVQIDGEGSFDMCFLSEITLDKLHRFNEVTLNRVMEQMQTAIRYKGVDLFPHPGEYRDSSAFAYKPHVIDYMSLLSHERNENIN